MRSLNSYIFEYKGIAIRNGENSIGDPDKIQHYFRQGYVILKFDDNNAYAYIYNKKTNEIIFGKSGITHPHLLRNMSDEGKKRIGIEDVSSIRELRYCCGMDDDTEEMDKWYDKNKKWVDNIICGRIWHDASDNFNTWDETMIDSAKVFDEIKNLDSIQTYICNWNELSSTEFKKINDNILKLFNKNFNTNIKSYIVIDNNGDPLEVAINDNIKVDKRDSNYQSELNKNYNLHANTSSWARELKRKQTLPYVKDRDNLYQKDYYDKTKSKTAAEWHNNKVKKYDPKTGKTYWGEKIGDHLEMKNLKDYINEQFITEHFVNCKTSDEMEQYGDIVWDILKKAYEYCGGIKNVNGPEDLIKDTNLWKIYRKDNVIKAVICYTDRKGGRKMCLLGSDGSDDGRKMLKKMMEDDFKLKDRESWVGVSGKAAITALKHGGMPIPSEIAVTFMGSKCTPYDEYWYNRPIKNADGKIENHLKIMVGNPPGVETITPPQELIDKLIKQAVEFGE